MRTGVFPWALGLICAVLALAPANAQFDDEWRQRDDVQIQPLDRLLPLVRREHPGRFFDAEGPFQGADGQMHYRLKWMTPDGRIVWFDANARTGRVLGTGGGRRDFDVDGAMDGQNMPPRERPERRQHFDDGENGAPAGDW